MQRVLIIGCGTVGNNLARELGPLKPDLCDKYKGIKSTGRHDVAFVCVDTPLNAGRLDTTEVVNAIGENDADLYVIKSTIPVGATDTLRIMTGKRIVFSPEYYGSTQHANAQSYGFTILGGQKDDCAKVAQLLQNVYDGSHRFIITDSKTAELAKLMENTWIATKVSFCNQFADIAKQCGVCYEELRELFVADPRVSPSHTFSYSDHPYWDSHCLNKDVPEVANAFEAPLVDAVIGYNESSKIGVS